MKRFFAPIILLLIVFCFASINIHAEQQSLGVNEFSQIYNQLLAGKTLVAESKEDGVVVRKERHYDKAINVGDGDFEIPVKIVITKSTDGKMDQRIIVDVLDRVHDLGGNAIINEEVRRTTVEKGSESQTTGEVEFNGIFLVAKNDKGGFDVHNFGLMPSLLVDNNKPSLAASMISYSCFPEEGFSKCVLTIRDYNLGDYKPLMGFTLGSPAGGDVVEISEEVRQ